MKATRKLIPAIVLLLVSVLLFSTATFAWFANNTTVEVTGLQISAQSPSNLLIKTLDDAETAYTTSRTLAATSAKLTNAKITTSASAAPTWETGKGIGYDDGTLDGALIDLQHATKAGVNAIQEVADGADVKVGSTKIAPNAKEIEGVYEVGTPVYNYYKVARFNLYAVSDAADVATANIDIGLTKVKATVDAGAASVDMYKGYKIYAVNTANYSKSVTYSLATLTAPGTQLVLTSNTVLVDNLGLSHDARCQIDVYIYLDGTDATNVKSSNFDSANIAIDFEFGQIGA